MLKTMRDSFHQLKWTLWAVVIVFILGFVYFSGSGPDPNDRASLVIARVGSVEITGAEFERLYRARLDSYREQYRGGLTPEMLRLLDLPRQVLDGMIQRKLELEEARRLKLTVSDEEVARAVMAYPAFQQDGQFLGREKYVQLLSRYGYTPERFEEELREDLLAGKYAALVRASILVPDAELAREFSAKNDKATIEYVLVPSSRLESGVQPTDQDLKSYYEKHRERYRKPEQRRVKYLLVEQAKVRAKVAPTDAELQAEYALRREALKVPEQVVAAHILIRSDPTLGPEAEAAAQAKAEKVLARAKAGEDFGKLAKEASEDTSNKESGGQLPPFSRGQMVPEFEQTAFAMVLGEIAGPVKTQFGYHVVKLLSKSPEHVQSFEEARAALAADLAQRKAEAETSRQARELAEKVGRLRNDSDEELRKLQSDTVTLNTTPWVARGEPIPGVGANVQFSQEAFSLKLGKISKTAVPTARGPAIVKPAEERPAGVPPLEEIRERVTDDWKADRREREALEKLEPAAQEISSGTPLPQIAARYDTELKTTPEFSPGGPIPEIGNAPQLSAAVFQTPQGQAGPPAPVPGGYVLFRVIERKSADPKAFEAQREELAGAIRAREGDKLLRSSLQQLRADRKVEINEELLRSFLPEERRG
ncbi:MAG: SurA N-terminal domain-containing protein [Thermoanaerobaculia bacterium]